MHQELEALVAKFLKKEDAVIFGLTLGLQFQCHRVCRHEHHVSASMCLLASPTCSIL